MSIAPRSFLADWRRRRDTKEAVRESVQLHYDERKSEMSTATRCDLCHYWAKEDYSTTTLHPDDYIGNCHRHAPKPSHGDTEHQILKHLTMLSWQATGEGRDEKEWEDWEDAFNRTVLWPTTRAIDWCGDFRERARQDAETKDAK